MKHISESKYGQIVAIVFYIVSFASAVLIIKCLFNSTLLEDRNFLNWDAEHYSFIRNNGYDQNFRLAFFPMFPLVWKALNLGVYGIVVFNAVIFFLSFYLLSREFKVKAVYVLMYLSIPSSIFFFLPYTESLFFAASVILLLGIRKNKIFFVLFGLLLCTLIRPAFTVLVPALVLAECICCDVNRNLFLRIGMYVLVVLGGLITVSFIQHRFTGEWFGFYTAQKNWGTFLQIPKLPLTSWGGGLIVRLDAAALLVATVSGIALLLLLIKSKQITKISFPKEVVFSLVYVAAMAYSLLVFRGGCLNSLNRYIFATPFIIIIANFYFDLKPTFSRKQLSIAFLCITAFFLLFGSYVHIQALFKYALLSIYLFLLLLIPAQDKITSNSALVVFITTSIFFQVFFLR